MAPRTPTGLGVSGRDLWSEIAGTYDLRPDERRLLEDACREADLIDRLESEINDPDHEMVVKGSMGQPVSSPLVVAGSVAVDSPSPWTMNDRVPVIGWPSADVTW